MILERNLIFIAKFLNFLSECASSLTHQTEYLSLNHCSASSLLFYKLKKKNNFLMEIFKFRTFFFLDKISLINFTGGGIHGATAESCCTTGKLSRGEVPWKAARDAAAQTRLVSRLLQTPGRSPREEGLRRVRQCQKWDRSRHRLRQPQHPE